MGKFFKEFIFKMFFLKEEILRLIDLVIVGGGLVGLVVVFFVVYK